MRRRTPLARVRLTSLAAALLLLGCSARVPAHEIGLRPEAECERVRADVASVADLPDAARPAPRTLVMPTAPPAGLRGRAIYVRVLVSEEGRVVPGSVAIEGSDDSAYNRLVVEATDRWMFVPARYDDCLVPRPFTYLLRLPW